MHDMLSDRAVLSDHWLLNGARLKLHLDGVSLLHDMRNRKAMRTGADVTLSEDHDTFLSDSTTQIEHDIDCTLIFDKDLPTICNTHAFLHRIVVKAGGYPSQSARNSKKGRLGTECGRSNGPR